MTKREHADFVRERAHPRVVADVLERASTPRLWAKREGSSNPASSVIRRALRFRSITSSTASPVQIRA
jgi:hypothetical protein